MGGGFDTPLRVPCDGTGQASPTCLVGRMWNIRLIRLVQILPRQLKLQSGLQHGYKNKLYWSFHTWSCLINIEECLALESFEFATSDFRIILVREYDPYQVMGVITWHIPSCGMPCSRSFASHHTALATGKGWDRHAADAAWRVPTWPLAPSLPYVPNQLVPYQEVLLTPKQTNMKMLFCWEITNC